MCHKMSDRGHGDLGHNSGENILNYWVHWCYCSSEILFFYLPMQLTRSHFFFSFDLWLCRCNLLPFFISSHLWWGSERAELVNCHSADNLLFHFTLNLVLFALLNILWCSQSLFKRRFAALFICMWLISARFCKTSLISKNLLQEQVLDTGWVLDTVAVHPKILDFNLPLCLLVSDWQFCTKSCLFPSQN